MYFYCRSNYINVCIYISNLYFWKFLWWHSDANFLDYSYYCYYHKWNHIKSILKSLWNMLCRIYRKKRRRLKVRWVSWTSILIRSQKKIKCVASSRNRVSALIFPHVSLCLIFLCSQFSIISMNLIYIWY